MVVAFRENRTLGIREGIGFGAAFPWPTCSPAYASPAVSPRPAQGWLPARAGSPLAGRDSHLLDNEPSFMEVSHPPIPFDPQGLVALFCLSVHEAGIGKIFKLDELYAILLQGKRLLEAEMACGI